MAELDPANRLVPVAGSRKARPGCLGERRRSTDTSCFAGFCFMRCPARRSRHKRRGVLHRDPQQISHQVAREFRSVFCCVRSEVAEPIHDVAISAELPQLLPARQQDVEDSTELHGEFDAGVRIVTTRQRPPRTRGYGRTRACCFADLVRFGRTYTKSRGDNRCRLGSVRPDHPVARPSSHDLSRPRRPTMRTSLSAVQLQAASRRTRLPGSRRGRGAASANCTDLKWPNLLVPVAASVRATTRMGNPERAVLLAVGGSKKMPSAGLMVMSKGAVTAAGDECGVHTDSTVRWARQVWEIV